MKLNTIDLKIKFNSRVQLLEGSSFLNFGDILTFNKKQTVTMDIECLSFPGLWHISCAMYC